MKVVVTGGAGFLGTRLADRLLAADCPLAVSELVLVDVQPAGGAARADPRVTTLALELGAPGVAERLVTGGTRVLFHLAAVVSGHAEADLDAGYRVNLDATRALLEAARRHNRELVFVFTSTVGVFGGELPPTVTDLTAPMPQTSYGAAKAMSELLICDYSRRGLVDGRVVRLPTVSVRAGAANRAVTSFASGVVREPLAGLEAECPVPAEQELWISSPQTVVRNLVHAATVPASSWGAWRVVNLPGLTVSVRAMLAALGRVAGARVVSRVRFAPDPLVARMVASFPARFDTPRALSLGFAADTDFEEIIRTYIRDDLNGSYVH